MSPAATVTSGYVKVREKVLKYVKQLLTGFKRLADGQTDKIMTVYTKLYTNFVW